MSTVQITNTVQIINDLASINLELEMATPSQELAKTFQIEKIVQLGNTLFVFSSFQKLPEDSPVDCPIGHARVQKELPVFFTDTVLKVRHVVFGHTWNWGKSDAITYVQDRQKFCRIQELLAELRNLAILAPDREKLIKGIMGLAVDRSEIQETEQISNECAELQQEVDTLKTEYTSWTERLLHRVFP